MTTYPGPVGRTARRLEWPFLPPTLRAEIEQHCGSPVVEAVSQGAGYTPGFASVLVCDDGSRHFVKAASVKAQRAFADSYREEARKLAALPPSVPAPRLLWSHLSTVHEGLVQRGVDREQMLTQAMYSPACGLALHSEVVTERVFALLAELTSNAGLRSVAR